MGGILTKTAPGVPGGCFDKMPCPIARSLERVGEWWSILILRDAFRGLTRFDELQKNLGIAPNMLTRRLASLVEAGMYHVGKSCQSPDQAV
jgi:DNA-binding HxlR family transcriptional regulator